VSLISSPYTHVSSAVLVDDTLDNGQINSRSFELLPRVQALEKTKEFVCMFHAETNAVYRERKMTL
jgi:hypothetical protein